MYLPHSHESRSLCKVANDLVLVVCQCQQQEGRTSNVLGVHTPVAAAVQSHPPRRVFTSLIRFCASKTRRGGRCGTSKHPMEAAKAELAKLEVSHEQLVS